MAGILSSTDNVLNLPLFLPSQFYLECSFVDRKDILVMGGALWPWADLQFSNSLRNISRNRDSRFKRNCMSRLNEVFILRKIITGETNLIQACLPIRNHILS